MDPRYSWLPSMLDTRGACCSIILPAVGEFPCEIDIQDALPVARVRERGAADVLEGDARCVDDVVEPTEFPSRVLDGWRHGFFVRHIISIDIQATDMTPRLPLPLNNSRLDTHRRSGIDI